MKNEYVSITTVSTFRHRYVIHKDDLQNLNLEHEATIEELCDWAKDEITMESTDDFSQEHLGEQIVETRPISKEEMLELFSKENTYLKSWNKEQILSFVRNLMNK